MRQYIVSDKYLWYFIINRLGLNIKRETHGPRQGLITLLHVWAMEKSTRLFLLVEVIMRV